MQHHGYHFLLSCSSHKDYTIFTGCDTSAATPQQHTNTHCHTLLHPLSLSPLIFLSLTCSLAHSQSHTHWVRQVGNELEVPHQKVVQSYLDLTCTEIADILLNCGASVHKK